MRLPGHETWMREMRIHTKFPLKTLKKREHFGRIKRRMEYNIKTDLKKCGRAEWIESMFLMTRDQLWSM